MGFLLRMKKDSARCVKNLVNLWTSMCSISSACLILMLMRTLLMLGSMRTRSFSWREGGHVSATAPPHVYCTETGELALRATVSGVSSTSGDVCASISGTLCRSAVCDAKLFRHSADVRVLLTAWR